MKKMKRLSAAMALALTMGVASQATQAEIALKHDGKGDALLFPVYNGLVDNYFTISNNSGDWIQGHLRFRGAAWSSELLDMDIILTPGDVFVFRVADLNSDGDWELDQSLDPNNFKYTAYGSSCDSGAIPDCMEFKTNLVPPANGIITPEIIAHHKTVGYIEFIGEAVLEGMNHDKMAKLLSNNPGDPLKSYQTQYGGTKVPGVTAWSWSDAANQFAKDQGLRGVPNVLSGTAFISLPGAGHGLAYNAEALVNFRTENTDVPVYTSTHAIKNAHRIDNYRMRHDIKAGTYLPMDPDEKTIVANRAVIVHDENVDDSGTASPYRPYGDYVGRFETLNNIGTQEDRPEEAAMSFQNTWGPTLADGDDYNLVGVRPTYETPEQDDFDAPWGRNSLPVNVYNGLGVINSIAEVEEAIRKDGQVFTAYYFDNGELPYSNNVAAHATLVSQYFAFFPTKVFWAPVYYYYDPKNALTNFSDYLTKVVESLVSRAKPYCLELWDTQENEACRVRSGQPAIGSPYVPTGSSGIPIKCPNTPACYTTLGLELNFFDINSIKDRFPTEAQSGIDVKKQFMTGRVVFDTAADANDPFQNNLRQSFPALMYTFELGTDWSIGHWRRMQR